MGKRSQKKETAFFRTSRVTVLRGSHGRGVGQFSPVPSGELQFWSECLARPGRALHKEDGIGFAHAEHNTVVPRLKLA